MKNLTTSPVAEYCKTTFYAHYANQSKQISRKFMRFLFMRFNVSCITMYGAIKKLSDTNLCDLRLIRIIHIKSMNLLLNTYGIIYTV